jgi:hypothetical protein
MTFEEAGQNYAAMRAWLDTGQMSPADFQAAVAQMKVMDPSGVWWQLDPLGRWLKWNGSTWVSELPAATGNYVAARPAEQAAPQPAAGLATPRKGSQIFWDVLSVLGSAGMAGAWYWYSSLDKSLNKPDTKTCITMVLLPVLLIVLRGKIDKLLAPLQQFRQKIPPMVLVGIGVAIPFLVVNFLYSKGISNYPLMFRTYVISTLLSHVVLRTPASAPGGRV